MARVRGLVAESRAAVREGRALIERAVDLRGEAFAALPVGTRLRYDSQLLEYVVELHRDGWRQVTGDDRPRWSRQPTSWRRPEADWVREQWSHSNWRIVGEDDLG
jgi:hypothetical protein